MTTSDVTPAQEVLQIVERFRVASASADVEAMNALWDREHPNLTYHATERDRDVVGWDAIAAYHQRMYGSLDVKSRRFWDVTADVLSDEAAYAHFAIESVSRFKTSPDPGYQRWLGHASFVLRRTVGGWRIIHYEESTRMAWALPLFEAWLQERVGAVARALDAGEQAQALDALAGLRTAPTYWDLRATERALKATS